MEQSILISTKKILGLPEDHTEFDLEVTTHINSAFSDLTQLGVGPPGGFAIEDETLKWEDYIAEDLEQRNRVKTYVYLKVRLLFDPPQISYLLTAINDQLEAMEFRLNVAREATEWVDPDPPEEVVL